MRGRAGRFSDRAIGIVLGILLGIVVILAFLFLSSGNTIDDASLSGQATQTQTQPAAPPASNGPKPRAP